VLEALALRRPVLISDTSGLGEIARKGFGRALPLGASPKEIAAAMAEELESGRVVPDLELPDWDACAQALNEVYRDVLSRRLTAHLPPDGVVSSWTPAEGA
jgi:glycosyltransferase involved in cell wall biosynthesis